MLFQAVPSTDLASRLPDGQPMRWDVFGPTHAYVDAQSGWAWTRPGGDWLDATGVRHGSKPWLSVPVAEPLGTDGLAHYFADATALVQHAQATPCWLALLLVERNAPRQIAGTHHARGGAPAIDVVYSDGKRERLSCRVAAGIDRSTSYPNTAAPEIRLPACLEFDRPTQPVRSAKLRFAVTGVWSGANPLIDAFLLDPPVNREPPRAGLAGPARDLGSRPGPESGRSTQPPTQPPIQPDMQFDARLDALLDHHPDVIGIHRYLDGRPLSDFVHADQFNFGAEREFDPAIYGTGPQDLSRLPHAGLGKWINAERPMTLVTSAYRGDGFEPLAPGLGALRLQMPAAAGVRDGSVVGNDGTLAGNARIFLPEPLFGRLDRIFVRYYMRLGLPGRVDPRQRLHVYHQPGQATWTNMTGKFGIGPDHSTREGGVSGTSGGGVGWQMRQGWSECDAAVGGPDERGWAPGFHLYDFQGNNPAGHRYGQDKPPQFDRWGQRGGAGGMLYAGHWYCIETELRLNTVTAAQPGFLPDGQLRAWVDGRLVSELTGMVFRTLPLKNPPFNGGRLRACRELGVRGLWLNWFHGGQTVSTVDRTLFYTGLVWARQYIGPMVLG